MGVQNYRIYSSKSTCKGSSSLICFSLSKVQKKRFSSDYVGGLDALLFKLRDAKIDGPLNGKWLVKIGKTLDRWINKLYNNINP